MPRKAKSETKSLAKTLRSKTKSAAAKVTHLIVGAGAGTGKTTTITEGLNHCLGGKTKIQPSLQQKAIWDALSRIIACYKNPSVCFVAFNKAIAAELQQRVPSGVQAMTMHSMGLKAVTAAMGRLYIPSSPEWTVRDRIAVLLDIDLNDKKAKWDNWPLIETTRKLVSLCKGNLCDGESEEELDNLTAHYDIDLNGSRDSVFQLVPQVLQVCRLAEDRKMDFDDMVWLPVVNDFPVNRYDVLLVDEAQDLNRCQQALAVKAGRHLALVGDVNQAIYGFAGADSESMERMQAELQASNYGCQVLPLNETRRCAKAIVAEAQQIVPEFFAHESNPEGIVRTAKFSSENGANYASEVAEGDMLLCRVNAPLVSQAFRFIKLGRRAEILGRDIGKGLVSTVNKMKASSVPELVERLDKWFHAECEKENRKRNCSEAKLIALQDRYDCLLCFTENRDSVDEVVKAIDALFTDNRNTRAIKLASIHKAKGLEATRVFLLEPPGATVPHPMAKSAWQIKQEWNLRYVAITRAINELVYVK